MYFDDGKEQRLGCYDPNSNQVYSQLIFLVFTVLFNAQNCCTFSNLCPRASIKRVAAGQMFILSNLAMQRAGKTRCTVLLCGSES